MLVCFGSIDNIAPRSIIKIVTEIKPGICAFVCHPEPKVGFLFYITKKYPS